MSLIEHRIDLFSNESVPTELNAYLCVKNHAIGDSVEYFATPWSVLIWRKELEMPNIRMRNGLTVCQHAWFHRIIPACLKLGISTLFTPHIPTGGLRVRPSLVFRWCRSLPIAGRWLEPMLEAANNFRALPFPHAAVNGCDPATTKDLWYSFIGFETHPTRKVIFDFPGRDDVVVKRRQKWHFEMRAEIQQQQKAEYQRILAQSRFSLCPRGMAPSTIRFWESLQAGAIPVLVADDMLLPIGFDWQSCVVRVAERDVSNVESILGDISPAQEDNMRRQCLEAYRMFSGENFVRCIRQSCGGRRRAA